MKGRIDHIGLWTWGGRVFNWKRYLDHMRASGMDTVVLWHSHVPANAREIKAYAAEQGIGVLWGFNWSWNSPVCLDSADDARQWTDTVLEIIRDQYAPLEPDGICFQVGGTEFGGTCRLDCPVCAKAAREGVGPLLLKFAGTIIEAVKREFPDLYLSAGVHLGGVHRSFETLRSLDPSINIMWEDLPGPQRHIEVPFAYNWGEADAALTPRTVEMVEAMGALRGTQEDVAFVIKGFPCRWGGDDPMLLETFDLKALATVYQAKWDEANGYCERHLPEALTVFRAIANAPARRKTVLLLLEHGLWELHREYAAMLVTEALREPFREPEAIVAATRNAMSKEQA
jgi:hypothetical protein